MTKISFGKIYNHLKQNTIAKNDSELLQGLFIAPWFETFLFCYLPYQVYLLNGKFWEIGIISSIVFSALHLRFGKYFLPYTFFGGLLLWIIMDKFGVLAVILTHLAAVILDLSLGWRKFLWKKSLK